MTRLDFNQSEQYTLSIRLSADGFSFFIQHPMQKDESLFMPYAVNTSYSMTANIKEMLASTDIFKHSYKRTNILVDSSRFTFVPFELFEDEQTETLFYHNLSAKANEIVLCNILGKSNIALLFGMDKHAHQLLSETFPQARFYACISPMIEYFTQKSKEDHTRKLYSHLQKETLDVYAFDRGKLLLTNTFHCKQISDQIYYLLYTWQQQGFNQEKDQLFLAGNPMPQEELVSELRKYLRQVSVLQLPDSTLPFDIQTLLICE